MPSTDVRVRVRERVIRVRVRNARVRAVIRSAADEKQLQTEAFYIYTILTIQICHRSTCYFFILAYVTSECKPSTDARARVRERAIRARERNARERADIRSAADEKQLTTR